MCDNGGDLRLTPDSVRTVCVAATTTSFALSLVHTVTRKVTAAAFGCLHCTGGWMTMVHGLRSLWWSVMAPMCRLMNIIWPSTFRWICRHLVSLQVMLQVLISEPNWCVCFQVLDWCILGWWWLLVVLYHYLPQFEFDSEYKVMEGKKVDRCTHDLKSSRFICNEGSNIGRRFLGCPCSLLLS